MPVSYEIDGTQYIAIQSGWGVDAQRIQDALVTNNIGIEANVPQGGVVLGVRAEEISSAGDRKKRSLWGQMRRTATSAAFCCLPSPLAGECGARRMRGPIRVHTLRGALAETNPSPKRVCRHQRAAVSRKGRGKTMRRRETAT